MSAPWSFGSFPHQRADAAQVLFFITRLAAVMNHSHRSPAVDDHGARHTGHAVELTPLAVGIVEDRKGHGSLLQPIVGGLGVRFHVDADHGEAKLAVFLVDAVEQRHLLPAWTAPARPEVEHHHLTLKLGEPDRLAAL